MKYSLLLLIALISLTNCAEPTQFSAMTYNIRYATERDGVNSWENRKEWVVEQINEIKPDVFGIQEGLHHQVAYLDSVLAEYEYVGVGRDDGAQGGEYTAIFYNTEKLEVLDSNTFWLSETPDNVSEGWDASMERIATWARFRDLQSHKKMLVFNAHLDHIGELSRLNSLKLIHQKYKSIKEENEPLILMGDLNAVPDSKPISFLNNVVMDSFSNSKTNPIGPVGTFHAFDTDHPLDNRIDYIFVNEGVEVQSYEAIFERDGAKFPSDHLPVLINYSIN